MSQGAGTAAPGNLPVFGVFADALALAARNSTRLLIWSAPVGLTGLAAVGAAALLGGAPPAFLSAMACAALGLGVLASAFSVRVHRMLLLPLEPLLSFSGQFSSPFTWRYFRGALALTLLAVVPAGLGAAGALAGAAAGLGPPWDFLLAALLPCLTVQAFMAPLQLVHMTGLSLRAGGSWRASVALARGNLRRLCAVNLLCAGFCILVALFAGWLVGMAFEDGPQGLLELLTLAVGFPAQLVLFTCLQAACYGRLARLTSPGA